MSGGPRKGRRTGDGGGEAARERRRSGLVEEVAGGGRPSEKEFRVAVEGGRSAWRRGSRRPGLVEAAGVVAEGGELGGRRSLVGCGGLEVRMAIHLPEAV
jgi:hypothetical protein